jgi:hypothetical protein
MRTLHHHPAAQPLCCVAHVQARARAQVGALVAYMLDAARQKELALAAAWVTCSLANTTNGIASWGHHESLALHAASFLLSTCAPPGLAAAARA